MQVRGVRPFFSEKYDITKHPRYKYLSDADKKNTFDVDRYLSSMRRKKKRVVSEAETFELYDIEEYFKSRYDLFRGLISFVVAMQWLIDHDFAEPTDRDARLMDIEVSRQMCDVWGELYVLTLREWLDGQ